MAILLSRRPGVAKSGTPVAFSVFPATDQTGAIPRCSIALRQRRAGAETRLASSRETSHAEDDHGSRVCAGGGEPPAWRQK
ncbi:hypothetical protein [Tahibacter aquaticus]|uniref:hypothetical protein n=1 Tax=Tahibacter aquaticus TaxID=520092 RepID=UPI00105C7FF9|nr:hypothetical protein [Tahibacter aquaticus]